jgi:hypothetical protein
MPKFSLAKVGRSYLWNQQADLLPFLAEKLRTIKAVNVDTST